MEHEPDVALAWRATTRRAFTWYLGRGYRIVGFASARDSGRCFYTLRATETSAKIPRLCDWSRSPCARSASRSRSRSASRRARCSERRIMLLELRDADGDRAGASAWPARRRTTRPETIDTAWLAITRVGRAARARRGASRARATCTRRSSATSAATRWRRRRVEMGLLGARRHAAAACRSRRLLGGTRDRDRDGHLARHPGDPAALVERAARALARGIPEGEDEDRARGTTSTSCGPCATALGPDAPLMADANNAYTLDDADASRRSSTQFDLMMIEQPLARDDLVRHAELQRALRTPICLDESITASSAREDMITLAAAASSTSSRAAWADSRRRSPSTTSARRSGIPVWCGGMLESGVGRAYNVALASLPNFTLPGDLSPSARYWARDIVTPEWTMDPTGWCASRSTGRASASTVDVERVDDLTVRTKTISRATAERAGRRTRAAVRRRRGATRLVALRRELHRHPELSWQGARHARAPRARARDAGVTDVSASRGTGLVARMPGAVAAAPVGRPPRRHRRAAHRRGDGPAVRVHGCRA